MCVVRSLSFGLETVVLGRMRGESRGRKKKEEKRHVIFSHDRRPAGPHDSPEKRVRTSSPFLFPHSDPLLRRRYCTFRNIIFPFPDRVRGRACDIWSRFHSLCGVFVPAGLRERPFLTISRLLVLCSALRFRRGRGRPRRAARARRHRPATSATTGGPARRPRRPPRPPATARATPRR